MCWSADTTHGKAMTRCHNELNLDTRICLTEDNTVQVDLTTLSLHCTACCAADLQPMF